MVLDIFAKEQLTKRGDEGWSAVSLVGGEGEGHCMPLDTMIDTNKSSALH